jgi:hypothetical protein
MPTVYGKIRFSMTKAPLGELLLKRPWDMQREESVERPLTHWKKGAIQVVGYVSVSPPDLHCMLHHCHITILFT